MNVEDLLREAISDHAATVPEPPDAWDQIQALATRARGRARLRNGGIAALGLVAAAVAAVLVIPNLGHDADRRHVVTSPATGVATTTEVVPVPGTASRPAPPKTTSPPTTAVQAAPAPTVAYVPLWPFRSQAEADAWRRDANGGHQPWHLDADQTALQFTQGFLGFTELKTVVRHSVAADDAHVSVGFNSDGSPPFTAAVIHLVRFGTGADAPWEVVGTDDTDLTLTRPAYGARASSPLRVGGAITGVDENIHVQVRQPSSEQPIGDQCCLPSGGTASPWEVSVAFNGATDPGLTVVAFTGGHRAAVERFAVTAVRRS